MKVVVVAGIPGSGSTTVLENALEDLDYVQVNYGDVMLEIAQGKGLVKHRDSMRKLDPDVQKQVQMEVAQETTMPQDQTSRYDTVNVSIGNQRSHDWQTIVISGTGLARSFRCVSMPKIRSLIL